MSRVDFFLSASIHAPLTQPPSLLSQATRTLKKDHLKNPETIQALYEILASSTELNVSSVLGGFLPSGPALTYAIDYLASSRRPATSPPLNSDVGSSSATVRFGTRCQSRSERRSSRTCSSSPSRASSRQCHPPRLPLICARTDLQPTFLRSTPSLRTSISRVISAIAVNELDAPSASPSAWTALLPSVYSLASNPQSRLVGITILNDLLEDAPEVLQAEFQTMLAAFGTALSDPSADVRCASLT